MAPSAFPLPIFRSLRAAAQMALLLVLVLGTVACGAKRVEPVTSVRVVVLDGIIVGEAAETRRSDTGYWLSRRDRFDSGNAGTLLGEVLSMELATIPGVEVYSRTDFSSYMAQKERLVARSFPNFSPEERRMVLERMDPLDYGRSLNADFVIRPRITHSRLVFNQFFNVWYSRADVELELWDVNREAVIWIWERSDTRWFGSQMSALEKISRKASKEAVDQDLFRLGL